MAVQNPKQPSKLFILPTAFNATLPTNQTPLRTAAQHNFPPPSLHVQQPSVQIAFNNPFLPQAPQTPSLRGRHRPNASIAQFALNSPSPFHPGHFQSPLPTFSQSPGPSNLMRSRRTASISLGGPPKALLGGPQRKPSPLSGLDSADTGISTEVQPLRKKIVVNLPEESAPTIYEGKPYQTPPWARNPSPLEPYKSVESKFLLIDIQTRETFPHEGRNEHVQVPFGVSLPSQETWIIWRKSVLEEKLAQLGVEQDGPLPEEDLDEEFEHPFPESISSPADPSLLHFKLNKLQRAQAATQASLPAQPIDPRQDSRLDPSDGRGSLESPGSNETNNLTLHAPQAWAPSQQPSHLLSGSPSTDISRPISARDFARGFGFNIPEEEDCAPGSFDNFAVQAQYADEPVPPDNRDDEAGGGNETAAFEQFHSRNNSKFSQSMEQISTFMQTERIPVKGRHSFDLGQRNANLSSPATSSEGGEATDSEGTRGNLEDAEESDGEYSNPSDEERERLKRLHLRMTRLSRGTEELPRHKQRLSHPSGDLALQGNRASGLGFDEEIVSNPSDEESSRPEPGPFTRASRPLPPIPHSRTPSNSVGLPPRYPHSRGGSGQQFGKFHNSSSINVILKDSLNPLAKPFTFGKSLEQVSSSQLSNADPVSKSSGRPVLNAFAQEFKPGSFSFRPPPGIPHIAFPSPGTQTHTSNYSGREEQGREKRVKRESISSDQISLDKHGQLLLNSQPSLPASQDLRPVSFNVLANPSTPHESFEQQETMEVGATQEPPEGDKFVGRERESLGRDNDEDSLTNCIPEPLEFQHHVSQNRVPASLFKALGPVGSHSKRQSLDDSQVQSISRKAAGSSHLSPMGPTGTLKPNQVVQLSSDDLSQSPTDGTEATSQRLERVLQDNLTHHRQDIINKMASSGPGAQLERLTATLESTLRENSGSHTQESEHNTRGSKIRDEQILNQVVEEIQTKIQERLHGFIGVDGHNSALTRAVEDTVNRGLVPVTLATTEVAARMDSLEKAVRTRRSEDQEILVHDVLAVLTPRLDDLRPEPVDFDLLTARLSTAVRPEIHELIDLTSDKKETAGLIMQQLKPLLQGIATSQHDLLLSSTLTYLSAELRQLLSAFDGHKLKDEISDLVFERLDSRLRVQEQHPYEEGLLKRLADHIDDTLLPVQRMTENTQNATSEIAATIASILPMVTTCNQDAATVLKGDLIALTTKFDLSQTRLMEKMENVTSSSIKHTIETLSEMSSNLVKSSEVMGGQLDKIYSLQKDAVAADMPQSLRLLTQATEALQQEVETVKQCQNSITPMTSKIQSLENQMTVLLGRLEVLQREKAELLDRSRASESECNILGLRLQDLEVEISTRSEETNNYRTQNAALQESLSQTVLRLDTTSTSLEKGWARVCELEAANRELLVDESQLKAKVEVLEMQVHWSAQNAETRQKEIQTLQDDRDRLLTQSIHKSDWQRTGEQLETLSRLLDLRDAKEHEEYQALRDRSKTLEGEHNALQKRFREQESKLSNVERASATARQNLAQAQQRALDWEKRALDLEGLLERSKQQLELSEGSKRDIESELAASESKKLEQQVQMDTMQKEVSTLTTELARANRNLEEVKKAPVQAWRNLVPNGLTVGPPPAGSPLNPSVAPNSSRASTPTPGPLKSSMQTPPENDSGLPITSTWNSMHAPKSGRVPPTPRLSAGRPPILVSHRPTSPTLSVVSNAPTLQEDGWWA